MNKIQIIGAGLAGLLAGNMLHHRATILEKQPGLPNNHHALLRFRTGVFSTAVGIPFKKVRMIKAVYGDTSNPIANELNYSFKTNRTMRTDRSLPVGIVKEDRFVAPPDLIARLEETCDVVYGQDDWQYEIDFKREDNPIISTIPMPALMEILQYQKRKSIDFKSIPGHVISVQVSDCDAYATYYYPQPTFSAYRASITGSRLLIESTWDVSTREEDYAQNIAIHYSKHFGIKFNQLSDVQFHHMKYAKILPIDDDVRKDFMHWATVNFNIYSLGRFATWRPGLLLDDLVHDVSLISSWINKGGKYNVTKHWV